MSLAEQISFHDANFVEQPSRACRSRARRNPVYLLGCHLEWCRRGTMAAYQQLIAALDDSDEETRMVAEMLLHRPSPRRQFRSKSAPVTFNQGGTTR